MKKIWQADKPAVTAKTDPFVQHEEPAVGTPHAAGPRRAPVRHAQGPEQIEPESASKTVIGHAMVVIGDLKAEEDLLISGSLEGSISMPAHCLTVAADGIVKAPLEVHSLIVEGTIEGAIDGQDLVVLNETARVTGNIRTRRLQMADGAYFSGQVTMLGEDQ